MAARRADIKCRPEGRDLWHALAMTKYWLGAHTKHRLQYHLVWIPKYRKRVLAGKVAIRLQELFEEAAEVNDWRIHELNIQRDHVHMLISIPPKYAVSQVVGYLKGKSAIHLARVYGERKRNFVGQSFWARGYFVSTVGRDPSLHSGTGKRG